MAEKLEGWNILQNLSQFSYERFKRLNGIKFIGGINMAKMTANPKTHKFCAFCRRWSGDADLNFKNKNVGFEFTRGVNAKCMATNNTKYSENNAHSCRDYAVKELVSGAL